ncbi:MAG: hypothetical protein JJ992_05480, partial [Planctomycetes bacterium]|nr:hypothetical protein [Planctomycetota bacterium]
DAKVIPNPRSERVLEPGDRLLAFGKLDSMRGLVPAKHLRIRRPKVQELPETVSTGDAEIDTDTDATKPASELHSTD